MSEVVNLRRKKIELYIDVANARILEIGALDTPTYSSKKFNVKYLDYTSTEELAKKSEHNSRYKIESLVKVDYVCPSPEYSKFIHERFDLVIANHIIEHIPDTISWFNEIYSILSPGGFMFLSVPDKRYTFDIARRNTTFIDILRNYDEKVMNPTFYQILEHFYYHKPVSAQDVWKDNYRKKLSINRFDPKTAISVAKKHSQESYADVHCHVFTKHSFQEIFKILTSINKIKLVLVEPEIDEPIYMSNEFHVMFRK